jgi:hypothetical protein
MPRRDASADLGISRSLICAEIQVKIDSDAQMPYLRVSENASDRVKSAPAVSLFSRPCDTVTASLLSATFWTVRKMQPIIRLGDVFDEINGSVGAVVQRLRSEGVPEFRIATFERFASAGNWSKGWHLLRKAPICGAKRRHGAGICFSSPRHHGHCAIHGGGNPHPEVKSAAGLERISQAQKERWRKWRERQFAARFGD